MVEKSDWIQNLSTPNIVMTKVAHIFCGLENTDRHSVGVYILRSCLSSPYIIDLQSISRRRQVTVLSTP